MNHEARILADLQKFGPSTQKEIARRLDAPEASIRRSVRKLVLSRRVEPQTYGVNYGAGDSDVWQIKGGI